MITAVAVKVEVDQLKGKIPGVCDARRLVRCRQGGESGETEESVLLSFDVESFSIKDVWVYKLSCMSFCAEYIMLLQVSSLWACGSNV